MLQLAVLATVQAAVLREVCHVLNTPRDLSKSRDGVGRGQFFKISSPHWKAVIYTYTHPIAAACNVFNGILRGHSHYPYLHAACRFHTVQSATGDWTGGRHVTRASNRSLPPSGPTEFLAILKVAATI